MSFYVTQNEMSRLSGRSKQNLYAARTDGRLPFMQKDREMLYDIDDPKVQAIIKDMPSNMGLQKRDDTIRYREEFLRRRAKGEVMCAQTGKPDKNARIDAEDFDIDFTTLVKRADADDLDRIKKEEEIHKLRGQNEKQQIQIKALTGGLIERDYVVVWVERYVGTLHTQSLAFAANGICEELYNIAKSGDDSRATIKRMESVLGESYSNLLKDTIETMHKNPV